MRAFPVLGLDPCPGDPASVHELAATLRRSADAMRRAADLLRGQERQWRGEAGEAFQDRVGVSAPEQLVRAETSFLQAGTALTAWAGLLADHQRQADALEADATELAQRIAVLRDQERVLGSQAYQANPFPPSLIQPAKDAPAYEDLVRQLAVVRARLSHTETERTQVQVACTRLRDATVDAAAHTVHELALAKERAPLAPALWRQGLGFAADVATDAVMPYWNVSAGTYHLVTDPKGFLRDHQEALRLISDLTGLLSSVMGILALVPVPGMQTLALPALALGLVSVVSAYGAEVAWTNSWTEGFSGSVELGLATTLLGVGALGVATKLASAAQGGSFLRSGVTIGGRGLGRGERPVGIFGVMQRSGQGMDQAELGWRVAQIPITSASITAQGLTIKDGAPAWGARMGQLAHGRSGMISR